MRDLIVLFGLGAAVPVALFRPWLGVLAYSLVGFLNPHRLTWSLQSVPFALMIAVATLIGLVLTREKKGIPWTRELALMVLLALDFTFTTFSAWEPTDAWDQWTRVMKIFLMTFVAGTLIFGERKVKWFVAAPMIGIGFYGIKGGLFAIATGGELHVLGPEGTYIEGNTSLGLAFNMVLPLFVFRAREEVIRWRRLAWYVASILVIIATVATYSRGAWVGLAVVLLLLMVKNWKQASFLIILVPLLLIGKEMLPEKMSDRADTIKEYKSDGSAMTRIQAWSVAWNVALDHPFTGAGFEFENHSNWVRWMGYADRKYDEFGQTPRAAHSIYFQVLGHHGFLGLAIFLTLLTCTLLSLMGVQRATKEIPQLAWIHNRAAAMQVGFIGYLVSGAFLNLAYFDLVYFYIICIAIFRREIAACTETSLAGGRNTTRSAPEGETSNPRRASV